MKSYAIYMTSASGAGLDTFVTEIEAPSPSVALNRFSVERGNFSPEITDRGFSVSFDLGQFRFYTYKS